MPSSAKASSRLPEPQVMGSNQQLVCGSVVKVSGTGDPLGPRSLSGISPCPCLLPLPLPTLFIHTGRAQGAAGVHITRGVPIHSEGGLKCLFSTEGTLC